MRLYTTEPGTHSGKTVVSASRLHIVLQVISCLALFALLTGCTKEGSKQSSSDSNQFPSNSEQAVDHSSSDAEQSDSVPEQNETISDKARSEIADTSYEQLSRKVRQWLESGDIKSAVQIVVALERSAKIPEELESKEVVYADQVYNECLAALAELGTVSVPALIKTVSNPQSSIHEEAITLLGDIGPSARDAVPVLVKTLTDNGELVLRRKSAEALGKIGSAAKEAVPALKTALKVDGLHHDSGKALAFIDPEAAEEAGVHKQIVELGRQYHSSPLGINGVIPGITTQEEMLDNRQWGKPATSDKREDGTIFFEYKSPDSPRKLVIIRDELVIALDVSLPPNKPAEDWADAVDIGNLTGVDSLPESAQIGQDIPNQWLAAKFTAGNAVLFVENTDGKIYARLLRLYDGK